MPCRDPCIVHICPNGRHFVATECIAPKPSVEALGGNRQTPLCAFLMWPRTTASNKISSHAEFRLPIRTLLRSVAADRMTFGEPLHVFFGEVGDTAPPMAGMISLFIRVILLPILPLSSWLRLQDRLPCLPQPRQGDGRYLGNCVLFLPLATWRMYPSHRHLFTLGQLVHARWRRAWRGGSTPWPRDARRPRGRRTSCPPGRAPEMRQAR